MSSEFPKVLKIPTRDFRAKLIELAKFAKDRSNTNQVKKDGINLPAEEDTLARLLFDTAEFQSTKWLQELKELKNQPALTDATFLSEFSTLIGRLHAHPKKTWTVNILNKLEKVSPDLRDRYLEYLQDTSKTFRFIIGELVKLCTSTTLVKTIKGLLEKQFPE